MQKKSIMLKWCFCMCLFLVATRELGQEAANVYSKLECDITKKIHLIGEFHFKKENLRIKFSYLRLLNEKGIYPKYLFLEDGKAACYIRTLYLESGDLHYLDFLSPFNPSKEETIELRKYYLSLPKEKRFRLQGTDIEYSDSEPHFVIKEILKKYQTKLSDTLTLLEKNDLLELINWIIKKENPNTWDWKEIRADVDSLVSLAHSADSVLIKNTIDKADYFLMKKIIDGFIIGKGFKRFRLAHADSTDRNREKFMINTIYETYLTDTAACYFGQFGMSHVRLNMNDTIKHTSRKYCLAYSLNSDTAFWQSNGKIYSNIIYYKKQKRMYVFLKQKQKEINSIYEGLKPDQIFFFHLKQPSVCNNIILFKR